MALPVLQNSGGPLAFAGGGMLPDNQAEQMAWRDGMAAATQAIYNTLTDILDVQKDILAVLRGNDLQADMAAEAGTVKDTSLDTKQKTTMFEDLKNIQTQAGDFLSKFIVALGAATLLWANDLEKYVATVLLPSTIEKFKSLASFITKIVSGIKKGFEPIVSAFTNLVKPLKDFLSGNLQSLGGLVKAFVMKFENVQKAFVVLNEGSTKLSSVVSKISGVLGTIGGFFSNIFTVFKSFVSTSKTVGAIVSSISKLIAPVRTFLSSLGPIITKILWPIQAIMSVFDFMKGYAQAEGNVVEKFIGGITEVFTGLFVKPLDLLKDLLSWTSEKLGFTGFSEWLDSFSLEDEFKSIVKSTVDFFKGIPNMLFKLFDGDEDEPEPAQTQRTYIGAGGNIPGVYNMYEAEREKKAAAEAVTRTKSRAEIRAARRARLDGNVLERGSRATGTGGSGAIAGRVAAAQTSSVSSAVAGATAASTSAKYPPNTVRGIVHQVMPEATETEKQVRTVMIAEELGFDTDKPLSKDHMILAEGAAYKLSGKPKPTGIKSSMAVAAEQLSKEQNATKNQLQPNVTVPSTVTSGMSAQAKQAERAKSQVNVAPSIVNAPTTVTNNTVASGGGGLSGIFSRSSSNPSERRAPTVTIGIRG